MDSKAFVAGLACLGVLFLAGCIQPAGEKITVVIENGSFNPDRAAVEKQATITWLNRDDNPHDVVLHDAESPLLEKGESWSRTFTEEGEYHYYCSIHSGFLLPGGEKTDEKGVVIVR